MPVVLYIHGGGFLAGGIAMADNLCRGIAKGAKSLVLSVEYRLAPEHPFPTGLDDCYSVLDWIFKPENEREFDWEQVSVCGDSSGGNLATACVLKDLQGQKNRIAKQILLYPALNPGKLPIDGKPWNIREYERNDDPVLQENCIQDVGIFMDLASETYVTNKADLKNELVSPFVRNVWNRCQKHWW